MKKASFVFLTAVGIVFAGGVRAAQAFPGQVARASAATCPTVPKTRASEAERALARGQFIDAERLSAEMPPTDIALASRIRALIGQQHFGSALTLAQGATVEHPGSALLLDALAEVRFVNGEINEALTDLNKALATDPCLARAHYDLSQYLDLSGMAASAQKELDLAYRIEPTDSIIRRAWKATQEPVPTPDTEIAEMREIESRPTETAEQKAEIESLIQTFESDKKGDCELVSATTTATIPLIPLFAQGKQMPSTGSALDVVLNGKKRQLLVDTGATGLTISSEAAAGLGLKPEAEVRSSGIGDEGESSEFIAHLDSMKIGILEFRNCKVRVQKHGLNIQGLFGPDTLRSLLLIFNFPGRELKTSALPMLKEDVAKTAPPQTIAESKRNRYVPPGMEKWSPLFREAQNLLVSTAIGNVPRRLFIVDTGMEIGLISPDVARRVTTVTLRPGDSIRGSSGVTHNISATGPLNVTFTGFTGQVKEMTALDDMSGFIPEGPVRVFGFIGYDIIQKLVLAIDYRDNLMRITNAMPAP